MALVFIFIGRPRSRISPSAWYLYDGRSSRRRTKMLCALVNWMRYGFVFIIIILSLTFAVRSIIMCSVSVGGRYHRASGTDADTDR